MAYLYIFLQFFLSRVFVILIFVASSRGCRLHFMLRQVDAGRQLLSYVPHEDGCEDFPVRRHHRAGRSHRLEAVEAQLALERATYTAFRQNDYLLGRLPLVACSYTTPFGYPTGIAHVASYVFSSK